MRCQLSNLFSFTQDQWNKSFGTAPSYTYNNNYLLLDYAKFDEMLQQCDGCNAD